MEAVKFKICDQCQGSGKVGRHACNICFGHGRFYFSDNNFVYWQKEISYAHIFIRELTKTINIIINTQSSDSN